MRIPLATPLKTRTGDTSKDARLKNAYAEVKGEQSVVRHRPSARGGVEVGTGTAQGGIGLNINGTDTFIGFWGDTLTSYTGSGTSWASGTSYSIGDKVSYGWVDYWALTDHSGSTPPSSDWSTSYVPAVPFAGTYATLLYGTSNLEYNRSNITKSSGKWYWEVTITADDSGQSDLHSVGFKSSLLGTTGVIFRWDSYPLGIVGTKLDGTIGGVASGVAPPIIGETLGISFDAALSNITVHFPDGNDVSVNLNSSYGNHYAQFELLSGANGTVNFGASAFVYAVPSGYNSGLYTL